MPVIQSKVTAQGQISVPAEIRRKLGLGPGSVLEWVVEDGRIVVTRGGRYECSDIRNALFNDTSPKPHSLDDLKEGIRKRMRRKYARG